MMAMFLPRVVNNVDAQQHIYNVLMGRNEVYIWPTVVSRGLIQFYSVESKAMLMSQLDL